MSDETPTQPPPGWYNDGSGRQRWWDGNAWTEHFAPNSSPKKGHSAGWWITITVLASLITLGTIPLVAALTQGGTTLGASPSRVTYMVTGDGLASVNYTTVDGSNIGQASANQTKLPWSKTVMVSGGLLTYSALSVIAVGDENTTRIRCSIIRDGEVIAKQESSGPHASVGCSTSKIAP